MEGIDSDRVQTMLGLVRQALAQVWRRGWHPADVMRLLSRRKGILESSVELAADAMADQLSQYASATIDPRWLAQLDDMGAAVWWPAHQNLLDAHASRDGWGPVLDRLQALLPLLAMLPAIEVIGALPGEYRSSASDSAGPGVDEKILARIRAMLAKAEATTSEAEAEAFTAGAQERMARYSIDRAMLDATDPGQPRVPSGRRIGIENPYESPRVVLLTVVASANRCRTVYTKNLGFCTVVGFESDLAAVETLYTSLLVQAFAAMGRAGSNSPGSRSRSRSFRQSFLMAYATRIGERLTEVTQAQTEAAEAEMSGSGRSLVPVLAARDQAVDQAVGEMFPAARSYSPGRVSDGYGWSAGRSAADLATLEARASVR